MDELEEMLIRHEGFRAKPYKDTVGKTTLGIGRNLDDVGITEGEARYLLRGDILRVRQQLATALPWTTTLDQVRRDVLLNMCFQLGLRGLLKFKRTLLAVKEERWDDASKEMLKSLWAKQVPSRAKELAEMMLTGRKNV